MDLAIMACSSSPSDQSLVVTSEEAKEDNLGVDVYVWCESAVAYNGLALRSCLCPCH